MKLVQFITGQGNGIGYLTKDGAAVVPIAMAGDLREYPAEDLMVRKIYDYADHPDLLEKDLLCGCSETAIPLSEVTIKAPILRPAHDVLCVGINYMEHVKESTDGLKDEALAKPPASTIYFSKRVHAMVGPEEKIINPWALEKHLDYEAELAVIIGKGGKNIPKGQVEDHIFGYSVFNDISGRETQKDRIQWFMGKSVDTYSCLGPVIVTKDELPFPLRLDVGSIVNGEKRQDGNTTMLMRDVPTLIHELSTYFTLEPGDILATGTPSGVAMGMEEPKWMQPGDVVECYVEGIGTLRNTVE
jgi:2-keto-4-pentenoate hydratase/2-oxohepta-3-ene-1,7-dioic acid hydratase in catechol pathway